MREVVLCWSPISNIAHGYGLHSLLFHFLPYLLGMHEYLGTFWVYASLIYNWLTMKIVFYIPYIVEMFLDDLLG